MFDRVGWCPAGVGAGGVVGQLGQLPDNGLLAGEDDPVGIAVLDQCLNQVGRFVEMLVDLFVADALEAAL